MGENNKNERLRVRSNLCSSIKCEIRSTAENELDMLLVGLLALVPYVHFVISAVMILTISLSLMVMRRTRLRILEQRKLIIITALIVFVSSVGSLLSGNVIGLAVTLGVLLILICAAYVRSVMTRAILNRVFKTVALGSLVTIVIVLIQRFSDSNPGYRPTGWQWNANYLGSVAVISALISMIAFFENYGCDGRNKRTFYKALYAAAFFANIAIILICESRSSLLAIMAVVVVYMLLRKHYILGIAAVLLGVSVWVLGMFYPAMFGWANSLTYVFTQRYDIWMCAFKSFLQGPIEFLIGRGPMTYWFVWETEGLYRADHAHNIVFDTLINVGVIGGVLYIFLMSDFAANMLRKKSEGDRAAFALSALALTAIFVQGIADVTIMWHQTACLFILACGASSVKKE